MYNYEFAHTPALRLILRLQKSDRDIALDLCNDSDVGFEIQLYVHLQTALDVLVVETKSSICVLVLRVGASRIVASAKCRYSSTDWIASKG